MLKVLLIGHFLGDFYLQFNVIQKNKDKWRWLILHSFIYAFVVTLCFSIYNHNAWIIAVFAVFFGSHFILDKCKCLLENHLHKTNQKNKFDFIIYIFDQLIHIALIIGAACIFTGSSLNKFGEWIYCITRYFKTTNLSGIVLTAIVIFVPTSTFIVKLFDSLLKHEEKEIKHLNNATSTSEQVKALTEAVSTPEQDIALNKNDTQQKADFRAGKIIGYLERFIILILFITELYTLIGLVLTAKSLARFKQLEDKYFAEKFLIGTLLSLVITILTFMLCTI